MSEGIEQSGQEAGKENPSEMFRGDAWELPTDISVIDLATEALVERLKDAGITENEATKIQIGFHEALVNAMVHGNLQVPSAKDGSVTEAALARQVQAPADKRVFVTVAISNEEVRLTVRDEGNGFDWKGVADPLAPDAEQKTSGRGLLMMRHFFDTVEYNEAGNEVTLIKRINANE